MNIGQFLAEAARSFPDRPAVSWRGATRSYAELEARTNALARWLLADHGGALSPGGRVALFADNCSDYLTAMFAVFRAGGAIVPCNSRLTADEVRYLIDDSGAIMVVTDEQHAAVARQAVPGTKVLVLGDAVDAIAAGSTGDDPVLVDRQSDDLAWLFYTSGTTGHPKGAMLTHGVLTFVTVSWLADLTPLDESDVTLHAAPLSHGAGFHALAATARGAHHVITDTASFDPADVLATIVSRGITNTWMVPTQIVMLTDAAPAGVSLPTLTHVVYGGAPMTVAAMERALERFGPIFVQLYGQGETPMTATVLRRHDHVPGLIGSAGRIRPGVELAIVDDEDRPLPDGDVGEVVVRGPSVMSGYWNRPEATEQTLRGGWLHTGDLGRLTTDGILQLLDRSKDMIISGGSNVYAVEVEQVLATHDDVADVAVIGLPDDLWGEVVVAVVVLPEGRELDAGELGRHCREALAGYKLPRRFIAVDALPRNAYGKILKRELRGRLGPEQG